MIRNNIEELGKLGKQKTNNVRKRRGQKIYRNNQTIHYVKNRAKIQLTVAQKHKENAIKEMHIDKETNFSIILFFIFH